VGAPLAVAYPHLSLNSRPGKMNSARSTVSPLELAVEYPAALLVEEDVRTLVVVVADPKGGGNVRGSPVDPHLVRTQC
jgi:hypothetical protein